MGGRSKLLFADSTLGQYLALSVAAHLVRSHLIPDPLNSYDALHMSQTLDLVGNALARVAPFYVQDAQALTARPLTEAELEGAQVRRGAALVVLRDGRSLSGVSIKRSDLRQAIAILQAIGIQDLLPQREAKAPPQAAADPRSEACRCMDELEVLLRPPRAPAQVRRANSLLVWIARHALHGRVANLAMRLMSAVHDARDNADDQQIALLTARLRAALEESSVSRA